MDQTRTPEGSVPEALERSLVGLRSRQALLARMKGLGLALAVGLSGLGLLGWLDFLLELRPGLRLASLAAVVLATILAGTWVARRDRRRSGRLPLAAALDRHGRTGGEILAGTELALAASSLTDAVTRGLALEAAEAAARRAAEFPPTSVLPARSARTTWSAGAAAGAALAAVGLLWPAVFSAEALRVIDPWGDHPPYAPYELRITPGDARVRYSDPFTIDVVAAGEKLPAKVEWVVEREDGTRAVYPMIDQGEGKFTGTLGVVEVPFRYHVRALEGRSRVFRVDVILTPRFDRVETRLEWPPYTRRAPVEGPYPEGGLVAVKGTRATVTAVSNRPLASGKLVWKDSTEPPVNFEPRPGPEGRPDRVVGSFAIVRDARFELTIVDRDGNACRDPFEGRITRLADRPPTIAILEPPAESYAVASATVPVVMEADDDFGLSRVALFRSLNGSRDLPLELPLPADSSLPLRLTSPLVLRNWTLEPGDVLEFYAIAADNDPDGAKSAQSKVHRLRIISDEDFRKIQQTQEGIDELVEKYRPVNDAIEKAREEARKLEEALSRMEKAQGPEAEQARREAREARERMKAALEEAERLAREQSQATPVFEIEKEFNQELGKLAEKLKTLQNESEPGMKEFDEALTPGNPGRPAPSGPGRTALAELRKKLGDASDQWEKGAQLPLEVLEKVYRLLEYESRFTALALAQDDLARRTRRFQDREKVEDPEEREEMRTLADEERGLGEELDSVIQGIRDAAGKLPPGPPFDRLRQQAEEFATAVVEAKAPESLQQALSSLDLRAGKRSAADTRRAADLLLSFVQKCEGLGQGGKSACLSFQPRLGSSLGGTLDQLLKGKGLPIPGAGPDAGSGLQGRGGASSAQRSGGKVGLYGDRPLASRSGGGRGRKGEGGAGRESRAGGEAGGEAAGTQRTDLIYGGVPIEAVPGEYRAAVREFFRRVVEESGGARR